MKYIVYKKAESHTREPIPVLDLVANAKTGSKGPIGALWGKHPITYISEDKCQELRYIEKYEYRAFMTTELISCAAIIFVNPYYLENEKNEKNEKLVPKMILYHAYNGRISDEGIKKFIKKIGGDSHPESIIILYAIPQKEEDGGHIKVLENFSEKYNINENNIILITGVKYYGIDSNFCVGGFEA